MKTIRWLVSFLFLSLLSHAQAPKIEVVAPLTGVACPCTIFGSALPKDTRSAPDNSVELGVRFTSDVDSNVIALRFYKMPTSLGPHVGSLWDATGNLLASITFLNETGSGWQQQALPSPVPIKAGATYTVSYFIMHGFYVHDAGFFNTTFNNLPLHATSGYYSYSVGSKMPTNKTQTNYYADVVLAKYVKLTWNVNPVPNVLYNVYRSATQGGEDLQAPLAQGIKDTFYLDTTVVEGQTYWYVVTATIQSNPSNELSFTIP